MNKKRPINLNLFTIRFPLPAIVSILHRVSGVFLFLLLPLLLWAFSLSLSTEESFLALQNFLTAPFMKFMLWLLIAPFCYHLIAGLRHLLMDCHIAEELKSGRLAAQLTFVFSFILILLVGVWLW